jgi:hypothetical protein
VDNRAAPGREGDGLGLEGATRKIRAKSQMVASERKNGKKEGKTVLHQVNKIDVIGGSFVASCATLETVATQE